MALPFFEFIGTYEEAVNFGKPIYRQVRYIFPTGPVEVTGEALLQGYHDRWYQGLTPSQRVGRMVVVGAETLITDLASTLAGGSGGVAGSFTGNPIGTAVGYGVSANFVSVAGDRFWRREVNPELFENSGLGGYP